jgi:hypothetical protein
VLCACGCQNHNFKEHKRSFFAPFFHFSFLAPFKVSDTTSLERAASNSECKPRFASSVSVGAKERMKIDQYEYVCVSEKLAPFSPLSLSLFMAHISLIFIEQSLSLTPFQPKGMCRSLLFIDITAFTCELCRLCAVIGVAW